MFKIVPLQALNGLKALTSSPTVIARTLKNELKVKWQRPERPQSFGAIRSGDVGKYEEPDQSNFCVQYQYATELEDAEPNVKKQFSLGWHPPQYSLEFYQKTLMDSVKSHKYDYDSPAAQVAKFTGEIRFKQHYIEEGLIKGFPRKFFKFDIKRRMLKRWKLLEQLRETDYKQFEWLIERMDLQFKPEPEPENTIMIARKEGLRQMTKAYCDDLVKQKLDDYRKELESQQLPFLEQKIKNLDFIRNEQKELGVKQTISQKQIDEVRQQYEALKKERESTKVEPTKKKWKMY